MSNYNIIDDINKFSTISQKDLDSIIDKIILASCNAVSEDRLIRESVTNLDLGFGSLSLKNENDELYFKFKPSAKFEKALIETFNNSQDRLWISKLENTLSNTIIKAYKDLF